jgi:hypothetical protein
MALGLIEPLTGISLGVKDGQCVRLITSPPTVSNFLENVEASTSHKPMGGPPWPVTGLDLPLPYTSDNMTVHKSTPNVHLQSTVRFLQYRIEILR